MTLELIEARYVLGQMLSDQLPAIACDLIAMGINSKSLGNLAGLSASEYPDARELFERALLELGRKKMSNELALKYFTKDVSIKILSGSLTPYEGAKLIWKTYRNTNIPDTHDYDPFIYAASEMEDRPRDRKRFERGILKEAKEWSEKII